MSVLEQVLLTILVIGCSGWAVLWLLRAKDRGEWGFSPRVPAAPPTCGTCKHFDLEAGQTVMQTHKAFAAATGELPPWQMAQAHRKFEPNPQYLELRSSLNDELDKANQIPSDDHEARSLSDARLRALQSEMALLNPHQVSAPEEQAPTEMLRLKWADMGACEHHRECRMSGDSCDAYVRLRTKR